MTYDCWLVLDSQSGVGEIYIYIYFGIPIYVYGALDHLFIMKIVYMQYDIKKQG